MNINLHAVKANLGLPIAVLCILAMVILPLPPLVLDFFFTLNIIVAILILAKTVNVNRPLDFSTFPTVILIATVLRLAMNVASTRVILVEGHNGPDVAGSVIQSFGDFVIGGEYTVGFVVFMILVIINFIVITKGTGRVSEVSARFKLDSMPGKQMAIDADLNTGAITTEEATTLRADLQSESDFYASMDGASKFVKGDAVAGIIILIVNIVGGLILGVTSHDLSFADAAETYLLLTIGDGIVAQLPGLILSIGTGVIITRGSKKETLGEQVKGEFLVSGSNFYITSAIMFALGVIPGMPNVAFLLFALGLGLSGFLVDQKKARKFLEVKDSVVDEVMSSSKEISWDDIQQVGALEVHIGQGLISFITKDQSSTIEKLKGVRARLSQTLGFLISPLTVKDDLELKINQYVIKIHGEVVSSFELYPDKLLAIGESVKSLRSHIGVKLEEPSFGLPCVWIKPESKGEAQIVGAQVVAPDRVLTNHLAVIIEEYAFSLFGFDEAQIILDKIGKGSPHLITEFNKKVGSVEPLLKVFKYLLQDNIYLKDAKSIINAVVENYQENIQPIVLTQLVRNVLGRAIVNSIFEGDLVEVITLDSSLQGQFVAQVQQTGIDNLAIEPNLAVDIISKLRIIVEERTRNGKVSVLVLNQFIRYPLSQLFREQLPKLHVIAETEIPSGTAFEVIASVET
jgi:flagellar biosynthesis protein FlhA